MTSKLKTFFFGHGFFMMALMAVFVFGLFVIKIAAHLVYTQKVKDLPPADTLIFDSYSHLVSAKNNPRERAAVGNELLKKNLPLYAAVNFAQAATLEPNYRDAAYGWAYALLKAKGNGLSANDKVSLHKAIDQAEAIDPLYPPLLELKKIVAEAESEPSVVEQVAARLQLITP